MTRNKKMSRAVRCVVFVGESKPLASNKASTDGRGNDDSNEMLTVYGNTENMLASVRSFTETILVK